MGTSTRISSLGSSAAIRSDGWPVTLAASPVATGDAAMVTDQPALTIAADAPSELILVDVPLEFEPVGIWAGQRG